MIQRTWWPRLNRNAQLAKGLVFAGLGGGASTLQYADASGYGNHGTLTNMDPPTDWVFDQTLGRFTCTFLGTSSQFVALPFFSPSYPHTLAGWARSPGSAQIDIISIAKSSANYDYFSCGTATDNTFLYAYRHDASQLIKAGTVAANTWYHVCGVSRASNAHELFVNGISIGTDTTNSVPTGLNRTRIGLLGRSGLIYSTGDIADVAVWNRALSPAEISQLADPSNTLLSGLILPPRRMVFPAAVAGGIPEGYASLSAVADIAAVGYAEHSGSAPLGAVASLAAVGYRESVGTAELVVVASVDAVGCAESAAAASLDAVASISAIGYATHSGATELAAIGGITAAGYAEAYASAELSAVAGLTAVGESPSAISDGYASLTAEADLAAVGYAQHSGSATLSAIANMVAVGEAPSLIPEGSATLSAIADMTAIGYASHAGEATLDAVADIEAVGYRESAGYAVLAAVADLVAVGSAPGEEGAGTGGKTADGLTWPDVDGLEWWEVDGLEWTCIGNVRGVTRCLPRISGSLSVRSRVSGVVRLWPRMSGSIAHD